MSDEKRYALTFLTGAIFGLFIGGFLAVKCTMDLLRSHKTEMAVVEQDRDAAWNAYRILAGEAKHAAP